MTFKMFIIKSGSRFFTSGLNSKLAIYLILACLAELTLLAVIQLRAYTKRDLSVHCVSALIFPNKSIELVEERLDPGISAILLLFHHRSVK